jgi:predicted nuclease with TOPRIM domain
MSLLEEAPAQTAPDEPRDAYPQEKPISASLSRIDEMHHFLDLKQTYFEEDHLMELSRATLDAHTRLEGVEARIDRFEAHVDQRFDTLEGRFDTLEGRFGTLEGRFGTLEGRFGTLHTEVGVVSDSVRRIEARIEDLVGRFTDKERPPQQ